MRIIGAIVASFMLILSLQMAPAGAGERAVQAVLGVPAYPSWTVHRLDDRLDTSGKTRLYQYQYVSHDEAKAIVQFYEQRTGAEASFAEVSSTYTINTPDGAMIQITAPAEGVPHVDAAGTTTMWASLVTIIRFQAQ